METISIQSHSLSQINPKKSLKLCSLETLDLRLCTWRWFSPRRLYPSSFYRLVWSCLLPKLPMSSIAVSLFNKLRESLILSFFSSSLTDYREIVQEKFAILFLLTFFVCLMQMGKLIMMLRCKEWRYRLIQLCEGSQLPSAYLQPQVDCFVMIIDLVFLCF